MLKVLDILLVFWKSPSRGLLRRLQLEVSNSFEENKKNKRKRICYREDHYVTNGVKRLLCYYWFDVFVFQNMYVAISCFLDICRVLDATPRDSH